MKIRSLIKRLIPPIIIDLYYILKRRKFHKKYIWNGIYKKFSDVPITGEGYQENSLAKETLEYTSSILNSSYSQPFIPTIVTEEHAFLPFLVSILCSYQKGIKVLDFGGGMGVSYIYLLLCATNAKEISYYVVENENLVKNCSQLFPNSNIQFYSSLPTEPENVDLVYISSALQYIENYASLLDRLCQYKPKYLLFNKLSTGEMPTYATCQQNLPETKIAYWFINVFEIIKIMSDKGYSLIFKNTLDREYNQDNFPKEYRMHRTSNLLFKRDND